MENENRTTENSKTETDKSFAAEFRFPAETICGACGAQMTSGAARFCPVCGKLLREEYQPLDRLRASYHLQGKSFGFQVANAPVETENLFEENKNSASETAKACVVYSLVPYLGILFCPLALLSGGIGAVKAYRKPYLGGGKTSFYSIAFGILIFAVQILLWWLLYFIPEMGKSV